MGVRKVIFDFGGIIVDLDKQAAIDAFARLGLDVRAYVDDYVQGGLFAAMETGRMSPAEFGAEVRALMGHEVPDDAIFQAWDSMLTRIPLQRLQYIRTLRARCHTYMLSNTNALHWDYSRRVLLADAGLRMEDCFDRIFLSYELHLAKPDPAVFERVMREAGLRAGETLFVDDSKENCRVAASLGLQVFHSCRAEDWMVVLDDELSK